MTKVLRVPGRVKADEIELQDLVEHTLHAGNHGKQIDARKRDVQEKADGAAVTEPPQRPGHQQQMKVLHPYRSVRRYEVGRGGREGLVGRDIRLPFVVRKADACRKAVKKWP